MILRFSSFVDEKTEGLEGVCRFPELMSLGIRPQDPVTSELPLSRWELQARAGLGCPPQEATKKAVWGGGCWPAGKLTLAPDPSHAEYTDMGQEAGLQLDHSYPEGLGSREPGPCQLFSTRPQLLGVGIHGSTLGPQRPPKPQSHLEDVPDRAA